MSGRIYLSGAQKRKLAEEKKLAKEAELKKMPKINQMFTTEKPSTSTSNTAETEANVTENEMVDIEMESDTQHQVEKSVGEICCSSENLSINEDNFEAMLSNVSQSSIADQQSSVSQFRFSTDVALWNVRDDLQALQRYWAKLGTLLFAITSLLIALLKF